MSVPPDSWVFDTGPLRHFAANQWLAVLKFLAGDRPIFIPDTVQRELQQAVMWEPAVTQVLDAEWINVHSANDLRYMATFQVYYDRLVQGSSNLGECGVLAMGKFYQCEIVLDDAVPRKIADEEGLRVTATVKLLCEAIRTKQLTLPMVESLADDLLSSKYYLPFERGGFRNYALESGLLEYGDEGW